MKKGWKIFWIVTGIIGSLGVVCVCAAFIMGFSLKDMRNLSPLAAEILDMDDDWYQYPEHVVRVEENRGVDHETHEAKNHKTNQIMKETQTQTADSGSEYDNVTALDFSVGGWNLMIDSGNSDKVRVEMVQPANASNSPQLNIIEHNGVLLVETIKDGSVCDVLNTKFPGESDRYGTLRIYLPEQLQLSEVNMKFSGGEVHVTGMNADKVSVNVAEEECEMRACTLGDVQVEAGSGDVEITGEITGNVTVVCKMGDVELDLVGQEMDYNYSLKCEAGEIEIGDREYGRLTSGRNINNGSSQNIDINCGNGDVNISFYR